MKECKELEEHFGAHFTVEILEGGECSHRHMNSKDMIRSQDRLKVAELCRAKAPAISAETESNVCTAYRPWRIMLNNCPIYYAMLQCSNALNCFDYASI